MPSTTATLGKPVGTALATTSKAPVATGPTIPPQHVGGAIEDVIRHRAYLKWLAAGMPDGDGVKFWLEAEREFLKRT
jgi:hypothetical protein